ncbi:hypothetical protein U1Q18_001405 [Sarracenia purpurea var. burkii]
MKSCELCKSAARMYCESDQASLCWDCDAKVHSANFLVARHSRSLLCHVCQSPTAWNASGLKLGPTVSVCESCVRGCEGVKNRSGDEESERENDAEIEREDDEYDDDDHLEDDEDENEVDDEEASGDDEDGDNQVVPWSSMPPSPPLPASSSSSEESSNKLCDNDRAVFLDRLRVSAADLCSDDDHGCSSSHQKSSSQTAATYSEITFVDSSRPLKRLRTEAIRPNLGLLGPAGSRNVAIVESLRRFQEQDLTSGNNASAAIVEICKLSKNPAAINSESAELL